MKAALSYPVEGRTEEEIVATRRRAIKALEKAGYKVVNTIYISWYKENAIEEMKECGVEQIPLCFLVKSLESMSKCHAAYFCKGWEGDRGCRIEHDVAYAYGLKVIYEED